MKSSGMLISLLLLPLLIIHQAQGMGLITRVTTLTNTRQFITHKTLEDKDVVVEEDNSEWKSKRFSGRARKLMITSEMATTASIAKNEKKKKEENLSVNSSSDETYPGILDIAGMDYSQARRKPPIHN